MFNCKFGVEVEFTGITRKQAATIAAVHLGGTQRYVGGTYVAWEVDAPDGRTWMFVYDGSISPEQKINKMIVSAPDEYRVEMVS
ncbi:MAG: amidoligase family protein, partial [Oscillospiraceae bacterium]|nr:amidoligase family protein [Oscillospiraceae bacterium]